ncbi:MAG: DUF4325 domain-containing protein [Verrucomicrobia bacterium]|nr:MAG: DUF4325 domain-containing protein [Verrucomicrobiota bacterium]
MTLLTSCGIPPARLSEFSSDPSGIESIWERVESVVFDFTGVTNLTDSFLHAYFGNMAEEHGDEFSRKVRFKGCSPLVRSFVSIAVSEGLRKRRELHAGC